MNVIALGSGAIGGYCGAQLARAGHAVTFVARGAHLAAITASGMTIKSPLGDFVVHAPATDAPGTLAPADLVLLGVKTYDNDSVLPALSSMVGPNTVVLTFQNGIDSADAIAQVVGQAPVVAGAAYVATAKTAPGVITQTSTHRRFVFGEVFGPGDQVSARVQRVADAFAGADMRAEPVADARVPLWEKFIYLSAFAGFSAATRVTMGTLRTIPPLRDQFFAAMAEVEHLARAEGVPLDREVSARIARYVEAAGPGTRSSMLFDLSRGARLELDALIGSVLRRTRAVGLDAPIMSTLYAVLKPYEYGRPTDLA